MDQASEKKHVRGSQEAGRERLLEAARTLFRSEVRHEVSRLEIARQAGVTPAMLTYYFATKADLVLAATRPVMAEAIGKLLTVLASSAPIQERLMQSVQLFLDFATENGRLLDLFIEAVLEDGEQGDQALVDDCLDKLGAFFLEAVQAGLIAKDTQPRLLLLAMWGMCRLVGEKPPMPIRSPALGVARQDQNIEEAEFITRLILRGTGPAS